MLRPVFISQNVSRKHCYENCPGEVYENYIAPCYAMVIIFVISSSKRIFVTFVTSTNHKQFVSRTWPGPLLLWRQVIPRGQRVT